MSIHETHTTLKSLIKEYMRLVDLNKKRGYLTFDEKSLLRKTKDRLDKMVGEECKQLTIG